MGRKRIWANQADKQAAYRLRIDVDNELRQLRAIMVSAHRAGGTILKIDTLMLDLEGKNSRECLRELVKYLDITRGYPDPRREGCTKPWIVKDET